MLASSDSIRRARGGGRPGFLLSDRRGPLQEWTSVFYKNQVHLPYPKITTRGMVSQGHRRQELDTRQNHDYTFADVFKKFRQVCIDTDAVDESTPHARPGNLLLDRNKPPCLTVEVGTTLSSLRGHAMHTTSLSAAPTYCILLSRWVTTIAAVAGAKTRRMGAPAGRYGTHQGEGLRESRISPSSSPTTTTLFHVSPSV